MSNLIKLTRSFNPPLKQNYSSTGSFQEQKAAERAIQYLVSDPQGSVYLTTPMVPEILVSLCMARYSRTELSAKELLWREFVGNKRWIPWKTILKGKESLDKMFNLQKAQEVAERILLQYGDDSVFELASVHLFFDRISMPAAKIIEDIRIGLSPLEKSTRYVVFDQKDSSGDYSYFKDPKIMESKHKDLYLLAMRKSFEFYTEVVSSFQDHFKKQKPLEKEEFDDLSKSGTRVAFSKLTDERSIKAAKSAYTRSIRSKACDVARGLLPAATLTNVGVSVNARALGYLLMKLSASSLAENQMLGFEGLRESKKILPKFFDVVDNPHGLAYSEYLRKSEIEMKSVARKLLQGVKKEPAPMVDLVEMSQDCEVNVVAGLLYPYANLSLRQILKIVKKLSQVKRGEILHRSLKHRKDRRHKPPRGFELGGYEIVFDILSNFGAFRDLHRHRMLTQQRQAYTTEHGFDMPDEFLEIGKSEGFLEVMNMMNEARSKVARDFPEESQYLTSLAHKVRYYFGMNLREAFWLTELRSVPQGHFHYRTIVQEMYKLAMKKYPFLKNLGFGDGQFVNMDDHRQNLERMAAMQRIERKLAELEQKYS
ncbi:MAG: FAD-dependent thymidylate synthase [Candidatus Daviesbacteria bacterium]|nr:FAD-dependent thymidylate synthase [Candidatus Daviesbacteria bacterium]